jgi:hypothetical protein
MMTEAFAAQPQKSAARMQLIHTALRFMFASQVLTGLANAFATLV